MELKGKHALITGAASGIGRATAIRLAAEGKFKAAEARFISVEQVDTTSLQRWLAKARDIQWDYKNIVRRKGRLERLK